MCWNYWKIEAALWGEGLAFQWKDFDFREWPKKEWKNYIW
jgi:hypothetical protein